MRPSTAGYRIQFIDKPVTNGSDGQLSGVELILIIPGLRPRLREAVLTSTKSTPAKSKVPILELVTTLQAE